jgi:NAD-dependent SIR2 family protein deacetylase
MTINDLTCSKCNEKLVKDTIIKNNTTIQVAQCPTCQGMIKSPECCGHDMEKH